MNGISWTHFYVAIVTFGHKFNVANVDLSLVRQVQSLRMFPEDLNRCWERYLWTKKKEVMFNYVANVSCWTQITTINS